MSRPKHLTEQAIKTIYDSFEVKDMPYAQFRKELLDLHDPRKAMDDLDDMTLRLARQRMNRMRIDKQLEGN